MLQATFSTITFDKAADFPTALYLHALTLQLVTRQTFHFSVPPFLFSKSIGILTDFPSSTPFGFNLGPD